MVRVFANGPGDLGSIPARVIPKTLKMVLNASLLNTQHYKVRMKGKVEKSWKGVAPFPTPWCSSYRVILDYGHQLYLLYIYIYIYIYMRRPWCSSNSRRKWKWEPEFKSLKKVFAFHMALIHFGKV